MLDTKLHGFLQISNGIKQLMNFLSILFIGEDWKSQKYMCLWQGNIFFLLPFQSIYLL